MYEWEKSRELGVHHDVEAGVSAHISKDLVWISNPSIFTTDNILVTNNFEVDTTGAAPTRDAGKKFIAMSNECISSDHVSLVCDLKWK